MTLLLFIFKIPGPGNAYNKALIARFSNHLYNLPCTSVYMTDDLPEALVVCTYA